MKNLIFLFLLSAGINVAAQVAVNTDGSPPDNSAILDASSSNKGFLPPRMTTIQRNAIASPAEGLVIYNTNEKALNVYTGTEWSSMKPVFPCGLPISINHQVSGGVAPVNKIVMYGTIANISGDPLKCWITGNLGADRQATAVDDTTEAPAGWLWQFNHMQGYKHDGSTRTPNTNWISFISENFDWQTVNDPCAIELGNGWRIPTYTEWTNSDAVGGWGTWDGPWNSGLKLHAAGFLTGNDGSLEGRGSVGAYWSSVQGGTANGWALFFGGEYSNMGSYGKMNAFSLRCLRE